MLSKKIIMQVETLAGIESVNLIELGEYLTDGLSIKAVVTRGSDFVVKYEDGVQVAVIGGAEHRKLILAAMKHAVRTFRYRD